MSSKIKKLDGELEKLLLKTGNDYNHPKILQKMIFILLISDKEISMEDLAKKTKYSLATLCNTIKQAEKMDIVERIPHPKTKRVYVKAKHNFYNLVKNTLKKQYDNFTPKVSKLDEIEKKYNVLNTSEVNKRIKLIKDVKKLNNKIKRINEILEEE